MCDTAIRVCVITCSILCESQMKATLEAYPTGSLNNSSNSKRCCQNSEAQVWIATIRLSGLRKHFMPYSAYFCTEAPVGSFSFAQWPEMGRPKNLKFLRYFTKYAQSLAEPIVL